MASDPLKKLQEIISDYVENMYRQALWMATSLDRKYPYKRAAFTFFPDEKGLLTIENNVVAEMLHPDPDVGIIEVLVDHDPFDEPKSEGVRAAFLKYNFWEKKISEYREKRELDDEDHFTIIQKEINIITTKLIPFALEILSAVASTYSITLGTFPDDLYTKSVHCRLFFSDHLWAAPDTPPEIQLKVEEFNESMEQKSEHLEEKRIYVEAIRAIETTGAIADGLHYIPGARSFGIPSPQIASLAGLYKHQNAQGGKDKIIELYDDGWTPAEISEQLNIPLEVITDAIVNIFKPANSNQNEPSRPTQTKAQPRRLEGLGAKKTDLSTRLGQYMALLTDKQMECVSLQQEYGLTTDEIGERLGITRQAVEDRLAKAQKRIDDFNANDRKKRGVNRGIIDREDYDNED